MVEAYFGTLFAVIASASVTAGLITAMQMGTGRCAAAAGSWALGALCFAPWFGGLYVEFFDAHLPFGRVEALLEMSSLVALFNFVYQFSAGMVVETVRSPGAERALRIAVFVAAVVQALGFGLLYALTCVLMYAG